MDMRKIIFAVLIGVFIFSAAPMVPAYAEDIVYQENVIDKISDWAATAGKDKAERDQILAQRKTERQLKHSQKMAEKMAKQAEKKANAAQKDMKKKLGF